MVLVASQPAVQKDATGHLPGIPTFLLRRSNRGDYVVSIGITYRFNRQVKKGAGHSPWRNLIAKRETAPFVSPFISKTNPVITPT